MNSFVIMDGTWQAVLAQAGTTLDQGPVNVPGTPGAQTPTESSSGQPVGPAQGPGSGAPAPNMNIFYIVGAFMLVFIFMTSMGGRKDRKRQAAMLSGLTKQDKVKTSGGIIGTVVEIHGEELVIRTDDSSNSRIRLARNSIQQVLKPSRDRGSSDGEKDAGTLESKPNETATV